MIYGFLGQTLPKLQAFKFFKTGLFLWFNLRLSSDSIFAIGQERPNEYSERRGGMNRPSKEFCK